MSATTASVFVTGRVLDTRAAVETASRLYDGELVLPVEAGTPADPITGFDLLEVYRDQMVCMLVEYFELSRQRAELHIDSFRDRFVKRIVVEWAHRKVSYTEAVRIASQALAFVATCCWGVRNIGPSSRVDMGWHTLQLYAMEHWAFCVAAGNHGPLIHVPSDLPGVDYGKQNLDGATAAMTAAGFMVDSDLWVGRTDCSTHDFTGGSRTAHMRLV